MRAQVNRAESKAEQRLQRKLDGTAFQVADLATVDDAVPEDQEVVKSSLLRLFENAWVDSNKDNPTKDNRSGIAFIPASFSVRPEQPYHFAYILLSSWDKDEGVDLVQVARMGEEFEAGYSCYYSQATEAKIQRLSLRDDGSVLISRGKEQVP